MQASTQPQTAPVPAAAATQGSASPTITTVGQAGEAVVLTVPKTEAEIQTLVSQRRELSDQLNNVTARRRELSEEIRSAPEGASRTGLEDRVRILDQRIVQLETDLATTGRLIASADPEVVSFTENRPSQSGSEFDEGVAAGMFFTLLGLTVLYGIMRWRRRRRRGKSPAPMQNDSDRRLERLEQGMESIAIEIERVSEGQRFVTKLLSEQPNSLRSANRIAQPVAVETESSTK